MTEGSWRQECFLVTHLSLLEVDFDSRLIYFVQAADASSEVSRNRRRLSTGRELLKDVTQALSIAIKSLFAQQRWERRAALIALKEAVDSIGWCDCHFRRLYLVAKGALAPGRGHRRSCSHFLSGDRGGS